MTATTSAPERSRLVTMVSPLVPVAVMVAVMWFLEIIDVPLDGELDGYGIRPRELGGLDGVVFAPFLHAGFDHLVANTLPFVILGGVIALGSTKHFAQVTIIAGLICGLGTWLTGQSHSIHLGASGLIFGYLTYLIVRGFYARRASYIVIGLVIAVVYGGVLWGVLPSPGISWQGHLFGAIGGVVAASAIHERKDVDEKSASTATRARGA